MQDIVDTAVAAGAFSTLVTAVKAAGLVDTLKGAGPFTVFAPTDDAFKKLPAGTLEAVLADKAKLTAILTYHVVAGKVMASDVVGMHGKVAKTVQYIEWSQSRNCYCHEDRHRLQQRSDSHHRLCINPVIITEIESANLILGVLP